MQIGIHLHLGIYCKYAKIDVNSHQKSKESYHNSKPPISAISVFPTTRDLQSGQEIPYISVEESSNTCK